MTNASRARRSAEPKRNLQPVAPARRSARPSVIARIVRISTVVLVFLAVVVLFGLVAFHALIVRNQARIDALNGEIAESTRARQELQLAVAQLEAPERIRTEAIGRLGMIEPLDVTYLEPLPAEAIADLDAGPVTTEPDDVATPANNDTADAGTEETRR